MKNFIGVVTLSFAVLLPHTLLAKNIAIVNTTVHTMGDKGSLENATVLIRDGKIQSVLTQAPPLIDYEVIDGAGKVVTPGLIGAYTSLGLVEVSSSAGTVDSSYELSAISSTGAALDVSYAVNIHSSAVGVSRLDGITSAATSMARTNTLFQGQGAIISLAEQADPVLKRAAFISTSVGNDGADDTGGSRAALWVTLEQSLAEAEFAQGKTFTPQSDWHGVSTIADVKALQGVISGKVPLMIEAHRAADILQVIEFNKRHPNLKVVLLKATEGWQVAAQLAEAGIAVILNPESNLPYEFDQLAATLQNAGRLHKAGVTVAIGMNTHNIRLAKQHAGNAVSHGLPWEAGLAALTVNPAKIYAVDDRIGKIEPGMQADIVIWSGDPLEVTEVAEHVFIAGEAIEMTSRQTKLRDRYLPNNKDAKARKSVQYRHP
ncbi:amidohydrolase family protein [Aliiglaciecola sp. LCG003]|uniref:amidohydrolase family protein n=1 Tax=Aliiglaciecola sp. LCG003 TaxID=3053655 RepID=UPI002574033C|nr:amidohydrolase family protein [Aliiglaciecola sp. LCG003]WJG10832.1 amidohydrolase family protein [Aliiglaciecola sp. LCG003]